MAAAPWKNEVNQKDYTPADRKKDDARRCKQNRLVTKSVSEIALASI